MTAVKEPYEASSFVALKAECLRRGIALRKNGPRANCNKASIVRLLRANDRAHVAAHEAAQQALLLIKADNATGHAAAIAPAHGTKRRRHGARQLSRWNRNFRLLNVLFVSFPDAFDQVFAEADTVWTNISALFAERMDAYDQLISGDARFDDVDPAAAEACNQVHLRSEWARLLQRYQRQSETEHELDVLYLRAWLTKRPELQLFFDDAVVVSDLSDDSESSVGSSVSRRRVKRRSTTSSRDVASPKPRRMFWRPTSPVAVARPAPERRLRSSQRSVDMDQENELYRECLEMKRSVLMEKQQFAMERRQYERARHRNTERSSLLTDIRQVLGMITDLRKRLRHDYLEEDDSLDDLAHDLQFLTQQKNQMMAELKEIGRPPALLTTTSTLDEDTKKDNHNNDKQNSATDTDEDKEETR